MMQYLAYKPSKGIAPIKIVFIGMLIYGNISIGLNLHFTELKFSSNLMCWFNFWKNPYIFFPAWRPWSLLTERKVLSKTVEAYLMRAGPHAISELSDRLYNFYKEKISKYMSKQEFGKCIGNKSETRQFSFLLVSWKWNQSCSGFLSPLGWN